MAASIRSGKAEHFMADKPSSLGDSVHRYMQGLSEKLFNWSAADHQQAADYADQRANDLRQQMNSPRAFKFDLSSRIKDLQDAAKYHRSKVGSSQPQPSTFYGSSDDK
jgi:hypothetical protein